MLVYRLFLLLFDSPIAPMLWCYNALSPQARVGEAWMVVSSSAESSSETVGVEALLVQVLSMQKQHVE